MAKKYIDADKLKAEIERLKEEVGIGLSEYDMGYENGRGEAYNKILAFLDSLPEFTKRGYKDCNGCEYNRLLKDQIGWQFRGCFGGEYKGKPIAEIELCPLKVATLPEQPVTDHHEIEVEFRGEKVTINREFYRDGEMNYSTSEQDDNAIWAALRAWCEKKGITPFELYPKQPEQPVEGLEEAAREYAKEYTKNEGNGGDDWEDDIQITFKAGAEWKKDEILKLIETRISEIIGDAQPNPVLRIELQGIIDKIK